MFTNNIIESIAIKLKSLYPDVKVEVNPVSSNATGKLFILITDSKHKMELFDIHRTEFTVNIAYVRKDKDNMDYNKWLAKMYESFKIVETEEKNYMVNNMHSKKDTEAYYFIFDILFRYKVNKDIKMNKLRQSIRSDYNVKK